MLFRFIASRIFIACELTLSQADSISINKMPPRVTPPTSICEIAALLSDFLTLSSFLRIAAALSKSAYGIDVLFRL